jgi:uncharacterized damage-inducible protein DinB
MTITELLSAELEREAKPTRRVLERVPEGRDDWKPHEKSMPLGYLAQLVATLPSWITMTIRQDELDLQPPGGPKQPPRDTRTNRALLQAFDESVAGAREALASTTDEYLLTTNWRLLVAGKVVSDQQRYIVLRDAVFNHLAHHRGQLTVYLRLNDVLVPAIYGPTADDGRF